jgi:hypothetical protein
MELTTSQAARAYETHPNVLHRLILVGRLIAHKNADGHWLINRKSLERWNATRIRRNTSARQNETHTELAEASA